MPSLTYKALLVLCLSTLAVAFFFPADNDTGIRGNPYRHRRETRCARKLMDWFSKICVDDCTAEEMAEAKDRQAKDRTFTTEDITARCCKNKCESSDIRLLCCMPGPGEQ